MDKVQENTLSRAHELLQQTREFIAYFELAETRMREWREEIEQKAMQLQEQQDSFRVLTEQSIIQLKQQENTTLQQINQELSQYNAPQFQRIAHESCEEVKRAAEDAILKSNKLLHMVQIRFNFFAVITTILTAFIIVLYLNGELPWEMHHTAKNERQAGKVLLQAWPKLNQEERIRIMSFRNTGSA